MDRVLLEIPLTNKIYRMNLKDILNETMKLKDTYNEEIRCVEMDLEDKTFIRLSHKEFELIYFQYVHYEKWEVLIDFKDVRESNIKLVVNEKSYSIQKLYHKYLFLIDNDREFELAQDIKLKRFNDNISITITWRV